MEQLAKMGPFAALSKLWNDLSPGQRTLAAAFIALSVAVVAVAAMIATKPRMAVLFSGLESADAGAITQKLDEEKVQYELSGNGTIEVPANRADELRLKMATQGLPQGGTVGFEQFDKSNFGMTEFTERVSYQRALQGELGRTICQLSQVMSARVMIVLPEDKVFASEQNQTTASVFLKLRPGTPLSDQQVGGIVHLVSSAIEGLKPENVTVVDSQGNTLSDAFAGSAGAGASMNQAKLRRQYENELSSNLQTMLTRIVGPDKAVVRVSADLDFSQHQETSETYEPAGATPQGEQQRGILASQETTDETYTGGVKPPTGTAVTAAPSASSQNKNREYQLTRNSAQYNVSKKTQETVMAPGEVRRLSVAVLVDKSVTSGQLATIREAVSVAAGIDQARKDQVTVQSIAFDTTTKKAVDAEMASSAKSEMISGLAKNVGAVVLLLLFLFFLRGIVRSIKVQAPTVIGMGPTERAVQAISSAETGRDTPAPAMSQAQAPAARPVVKQDLPAEVVQSSPEDLARLVKAWMSER